ncbi:hypothetical protein Tco_1533479 [Tanacetum coccineum]
MAKIQEVPTADSGIDTEPLEHVQYDAEYNAFANERQQSEQPESISSTCVVEKVDSNVIPDSSDMCDNNIQTDQNAEDESVALECKSILAETSRTLGESNSIRDSCLIALKNKQIELETYKTLNDRTLDYDKLKRKLNETLGLLAQKEIDIKEGLKLKAYEILVFKEKHNELVKQSFLTKSHYKGLVKEKTKVRTDLKHKEEKDIDKMISMEKQLKFLNEIVYKMNQTIQTTHMLAPKGPTFNGTPTFANPIYLKKAQSEKPCLYEILYDTSDLANRFVLDREETLTLEKESRSKLNKDLVKLYDYTKQNSLYESFKPTKQEYHEQLAHANEVRKKMWRKSFVKSKPKFFKNIGFSPTSKSISKSRQAYNVMTNNINHFRELGDQAWEKYFHDHFRAPTAHDMEILIKTCLMPLALKTQNDSFKFVHELKQEMHADLKTNENDTVCKEKASNVFLKEREQYFKIQDLKGQLQDNNIAISELKKLIEKCKGKSMETKFDKPSVVRQPNAQRIPKPSVLGKPTPFSDSLERKSFSKTKSNPKTNVLEGLSKPVTTQILPQTTKQAVRNTHVIKPGMYQINTRKTQTKASQLPQTSRNTNPRVSTYLYRSNLKLLCNFVEKYLGIIRFGNDQFALILSYGDLVQGNFTINRVYYVEGLNQNLFSVGQFYNADLEVAFWKSTCFVRDLEGNDLLTDNHGYDLYTISLQETSLSTPIYFMAKV